MPFEPPGSPPPGGAALLPPPAPPAPGGPSSGPRPPVPDPTPGRGPARTALLAVLGLVSALMILQGALVLVGLWFRTTTRTPLVVDDAAGITTVRVDVDAGTVRLEPGEQVAGERRDRYGLVKPATEVRRDGNTLVVSGRCRRAWLAGSWCSTDVTLTVPPTVRVVVRSGAGDVHLGATTGGVDVSTGAGDVHFTSTGGDTIVASSGAGDVRADSLTAAAVDMESGAGDVDVRFAEVPDEVRARSGAGDVVVELPDGETVYRVDAESGAGTRNVDVRTSPTATVAVVVRSGAGDVDVRYATGR